MKWVWQRFRKERGATAIEFAFLAPVLFMFIFGIIEFGVIMTTQSALESSISQAARKYRALARSDNLGVQADVIHTFVVDSGGGLINGANLIVKANMVSWGSSMGMAAPASGETNQGQSGGTDNVVHYRAFYKYSVMTPFLSEIIGGEDGIVELVASTVVQNEPAIGGAGGI